MALASVPKEALRPSILSRVPLPASVVTTAKKGAYVPATQAVQLEVPVDSVLYLPGPQDVQLEAPAACELYAPAAHDVQTRDVDAVATLLYVPNVQAVQTVPPTSARKVPGVQGEAHCVQDGTVTKLKVPA